MKKVIIRQGDVCLVKTDAVIKGKTKKYENGKSIIAYGEQSGHAHALLEREANIIESDNIDQVDVKTVAPLTHQEHSALVLLPGKYDRPLQMEYTPEDLKIVAD